MLDRKVTWNIPPTLEEFYKNPGGKGNTANNINAVRHVMSSRYEILTQKLDKKIPVRIFEENESSYYFLIVIPSDMRDYDYDVVVHLYDGGSESSSLKKWNVEFFSNCPSFIFTYAYVYELNGLLIPFLKPKLGKEALKKLPVDKNPDLSVGWDKSIYYAINKIMTSITLNQKYAVKRNAEPFNPQVIFNAIRSFDEVMDDLENTKKDRLGVRKKLHMTKTQKRVEKAKTAVKNKIKDVIEKKIESKITHNYNSKGKVIGKPKITGKRNKRK